MRIIPRRKRTWLLVLVGVAIVGVSLWMAASEKSEFERRYDRIPLGVSFEEVSSLMEPGSLFSIHKEFLPSHTYARAIGPMTASTSF